MVAAGTPAKLILKVGPKSESGAIRPFCHIYREDRWADAGPEVTWQAPDRHLLDTWCRPSNQTRRFGQASLAGPADRPIKTGPATGSNPPFPDIIPNLNWPIAAEAGKVRKTVRVREGRKTGIPPIPCRYFADTLPGPYKSKDSKYAFRQ